MCAKIGKGKEMAAMIVVDVKNELSKGGGWAVAGGDQIVRQINNVMADYDAVILTQDWHPAGHSSFASSHEAEVFSKYCNALWCPSALARSLCAR